ncbi:MAG: hypothetical protein CMM78_00960 [Rhodospirillaceae bacterium]|nr:hypothetical protein [Rhodospirillales bacterium]MAO91386.1 hypothetical protein [Rhodospirillales bacterium]MAX46751.1 hypothetical protein [Rhodospirillaceae bacterium]
MHLSALQRNRRNSVFVPACNPYSVGTMTTHKNTNQGQGSKQAETPAPDALPEIADLARDFADLWQEQLSAMAADPSLAAGMTETMKLWQQGLAMMGGTPPKTPDQAGLTQAWGAMNAAMQDAMTTALSAWTPPQSNAAKGTTGMQASGGTEKNGDKDQTAPKAGAAPTAHPSDGSERLLHELDRRFADLEGRINRLESRSEAARAGTDGAAGSPGPAPSKKAKSKKATARKSAAKKIHAKKPAR